jgi:hypothetical protein
LAPLQTNILKKYVQLLSIGDGGKLIFYYHLHFASYVMSRLWKPGLTGAIFRIYSGNILALLIGLAPQAAAWLASPIIWPCSGYSLMAGFVSTCETFIP